MPLTESDIREIIEESAFAWKADELMAAAKPAIRLRAERAAMNSLPPGASRFGGVPDLPPGAPWPEHEGRPLQFLAQISFAEAARVVRLPGLPEDGGLVVFYDFHARNGNGGDIWRGLFFEGNPAALRRADLPEPVDRDVNFCVVEPHETFDFHPCALTMEPWLCPPNEAAFRAAGIEGGGHHRDDWWDLHENFVICAGQPCHLLGGLPLPIQNDPLAGADWHLLLQLDTDEKGPGWMWGDVGRMYFQITERGLAARDFGQVAASWDCY